MSEQRCSKSICTYGSWHGRQCTKTAIVQHNGVWFCRVHDPDYVKAKMDKKQIAWRKEWDRKMANSSWELAAHSLCSGVDTETMKSLGSGWVARQLEELRKDKLKWEAERGGI